MGTPCLLILSNIEGFILSSVEGFILFILRSSKEA